MWMGSSVVGLGSGYPPHTSIGNNYEKKQDNDDDDDDDDNDYYGDYDDDDDDADDDDDDDDDSVPAPLRGCKPSPGCSRLRCYTCKHLDLDLQTVHKF